MPNSSEFFSNQACAYFPCHKTGDAEHFNCMFCYCPLYALKDRCGGNFTYLENGVKDCSNCLLPHSEKGYAYIMEHIAEVIELGKRVDDE